jgi:hypothetical protein
VNLVRAEVHRLLARRFTQVLLVLMLAAFGVTFATTVASTHQPTDIAVAYAQIRVDQVRSEVVQLRRECEAQRAEEIARGNGRFAADCRHLDPNQVRIENYLAGVFVFEDSIRDLVYFLAAFLALFGFLVGASYIGAELTSGGMTNLLLWRPRRDVVLLAKLGTLLGVVAVTTVVSTVLYVGGFWALAQRNGFTGQLTPRFWGDLTLLSARGLGLTLIVTALAFGAATLGRHTAAALGLIAAYAVVWEIGGRIVMDIIRFPRYEALMVSEYIGAWMTGKVDQYDSSCVTACHYQILFWHSSVVFVILLALLVGGAFVTFRRRDLA